MHSPLKGNDSKLMYSGTSNVVLPVPNKLSFPEAFRDKSRLTYYASMFNTVEINSTFRKLPMPQTVEKWAASVPGDFQFTFKLPGVISHKYGLAFNSEDVNQFMQVVAACVDKKGCLLVQFPGTLTVAYSGQLKKLLTLIRRNDPEGQWKIACEFRHSSWYHNDTYDLLRLHHTGMVLHDMPSSPPLQVNASGFVYVRFHGPESGYQGSYPDDFLDAYAKRIKAWHDEGKMVYVYFNNTVGDAVNNLITLNRYVVL